jgi:hypothetical protein
MKAAGAFRGLPRELRERDDMTNWYHKTIENVTFSNGHRDSDHTQ